MPSRPIRRRLGAMLSIVAVGAAVVTSGCDPGTPNTGPSTDVSPYVVPTAPGAEIKALWTVGDPAPRARAWWGYPTGSASYRPLVAR
jgi:hypothetical protein